MIIHNNVWKQLWLFWLFKSSYFFISFLNYPNIGGFTWRMARTKASPLRKIRHFKIESNDLKKKKIALRNSRTFNFEYKWNTCGSEIKWSNQNRESVNIKLSFSCLFDVSVLALSLMKFCTSHWSPVTPLLQENRLV